MEVRFKNSTSKNSTSKNSVSKNSASSKNYLNLSLFNALEVLKNSKD